VFHLKKEFTKSSLVLYLSFILVTWSLLQISLTDFFENNDHVLLKIPSIYASDDGGNGNGGGDDGGDGGDDGGDGGDDGGDGGDDGGDGGDDGGDGGDDGEVSDDNGDNGDVDEELSLKQDEDEGEDDEDTHEVLSFSEDKVSEVLTLQDEDEDNTREVLSPDNEGDVTTDLPVPPEPPVNTDLPVPREPIVPPEDLVCFPGGCIQYPECNPSDPDCVPPEPLPKVDDCDKSYPDNCIPPKTSPESDLDCDDISDENFKVSENDPHDFDRDGDGIGCESGNDDDSVDNGDHCDKLYPDNCIPSPPPDLDCDDISHKNFKVSGDDPHDFDRDNDGWGCESGDYDDDRDHDDEDRDNDRTITKKY
jgi:hypothetical protein